MNTIRSDSPRSSRFHDELLLQVSRTYEESANTIRVVNHVMHIEKVDGAYDYIRL